MNPKLPLDGRIYTLTVGRVLNIIVFQINLDQLLFTATLRVRLGSCLSTALKMDNLDCTKINAHSSQKNSQLVYGRGSFTTASAHCQPHLSPLCWYTTHSSVPHTATIEMACLRQCSTNGKLRILVNTQPAPQAPGHCHQLGLAYGRETWLYPTNTLSATVRLSAASRHKTCFHKQGLLTTHSYRHDSTLLNYFLCFFFFFFFQVDLSLTSKFRPPHEGFRQATS